MTTPVSAPHCTPGLSRTVSAMRLAVAIKGMSVAETREAVAAAKDKAKGLGLMPKDTDTLRAEYARACARVR